MIGSFLAWLGRSAGALALLWFGGFLWFVGHLPAAGGAAVEAQGIVVLTGRPERLQVGFDLLREGKAKRLLISGVGQGTSARHLASVLGADPVLAGCCVDLGHDALDTSGNAVEAMTWAARHGFDTIILVTSVYHGPRSLVLFRMAMPKARIATYLVSDTRESLGAWWRNFAVARLLGVEFSKYVVALLRARLAGFDR